MDITLPKDMEEFVLKQVAQGAYPDISTIVTEALNEFRACRDPHVDSPELEAWLLEAEGSPESPYQRADLEAVRQKVLAERNSQCR